MRLFIQVFGQICSDLLLRNLEINIRGCLLEIFCVFVQRPSAKRSAPWTTTELDWAGAPVSNNEAIRDRIFFIMR